MLKSAKKLWLILLLVIVVGLACGVGDPQQREANKLVGEANALVDKYNEIVPKSDKLNEDLNPKMNSLQNSEDFAGDYAAFKKENKSKLDELTGFYDQLTKLGSDAVDKFDQASKLKLANKYKEYLNSLTQQWKKRNEMNKQQAASLESMLEAKDAADFAKLKDSVKKIDDLQKEVDELKAKTDQLSKDVSGK